ncbi:MAG: 2-oxoacid ferredoxin oxidoreductase [Candidatus Heimdallarchaeota archaeon]|nr:2-oxoacid ferredoxin oxidoreductase [Candidatus Heimdallarchaeota archaeon]
MNDVVELKITSNDWKVPIKPTWCPGCGDYGVLSATKKAVVDKQLVPHNTVVVSGIGCSSNFPHFIGGYGIHTLHGRADAVGEGIKMVNPDLDVMVVGGDGDGLGIGLSGMLHAARRNFNLTRLILNNQVYGLTVNQASPTSDLGRITRSTPYGNIERPLNPVLMALSAGATFVARIFSGDSEHSRSVIRRAMEHKGYAFIDALSPCVTFNKVNTNKFWEERVYRLEETDYRTDDYNIALLKSLEFGDKVPIGVFYQAQVDEYTELDETIKKISNPVKNGANRLSEEVRNTIMKDFM